MSETETYATLVIAFCTKVFKVTANKETGAINKIEMNKYFFII